MAPQSSAKFVSYELRPAKQCERKILLEVLSSAAAVGFPVGDYRYVGMGANRFYDFIMMHKTFGIRRMISLEHDPKMLERARFNCPYSFIDVFPKSAGEFAHADDFKGNSVFWLDFDGSIGPHIAGDVTAFGTKARPGDFLFITVPAAPPRRLERSDGKQRLAELKDALGPFAGELTLGDMESANFSNAVHKILTAVLKYAFAAREDAEFRQSFNVEYADGMQMITVGGLLAEVPKLRSFSKEIAARLPHLPKSKSARYNIRKLDWTEKERGLIDRAVTARRSNSKERNQAKLLGFSARDIEAYTELLRFYPRYVETFL